MKYNHAFDLAFCLVSEHEDSADVTTDELMAGLLARVKYLVDNPMEHDECFGDAFDTYEIEED